MLAKSVLLVRYIRDRIQREIMPVKMLSQMFLDFQATKPARMPASNRSFPHVRLNRPPGMTNSGRTNAERTAGGTSRNPR